MAARTIGEALTWVEMQTVEGAEAALTATGRLLAWDPLCIEALHIMAVALYLLGM